MRALRALSEPPLHPPLLWLAAAEDIGYSTANHVQSQPKFFTYDLLQERDLNNFIKDNNIIEFSVSPFCVKYNNYCESFKRTKPIMSITGWVMMFYMSLVLGFIVSISENYWLLIFIIYTSENNYYSVSKLYLRWQKLLNFAGTNFCHFGHFPCTNICNYICTRIL